MAELMTPRGFFSILRWRSDPTRDEAKNVAVVLVDEKGTFGGVRAAPLSRISPRLQEQGLLDAIVVELERGSRIQVVRRSLIWNQCGNSFSNRYT